MIFVGLFMMPFYYGSRARSVPECLRLRFDEKARTLNAISFAFMTILASGINMYAMALVFKLMLGWSMHATIILLSALVVLVHTALGGLTSSIYNEVLQFFLIVLGILPLAILRVSEAGGWSGMAARLPSGFVHTWKGLGNAQNNPMDIEWFGMECWSRSYGLVSSERTLYRPLDAATQMINLNLWWGIMPAFGIFMVLGAVRSGRKDKQ